MPHKIILAVNDDVSQFTTIKETLSKQEFDVEGISRSRITPRTASEFKPELIILDIDDANEQSFNIIRDLQTGPTRNIPLIVISASNQEPHIVEALEAGADDVIMKPVTSPTLAARVKAVLRRAGSNIRRKDTEVLKLEKLSIDPLRHEVKIDDTKIDLTVGEFNLLHFLASQRGEVFTRSQIIKTLHGPNYGIANRSVDVQLVGIRGKLGPYSSYLETVRGVGYRFRDPEEKR